MGAILERKWTDVLQESWLGVGRLWIFIPINGWAEIIIFCMKLWVGLNRQ
jgi:hypothetical protein